MILYLLYPQIKDTEGFVEKTTSRLPMKNSEYKKEKEERRKISFGVFYTLGKRGNIF